MPRWLPVTNSGRADHPRAFPTRQRRTVLFAAPTQPLTTDRALDNAQGGANQTAVSGTAGASAIWRLATD